MKTSAGEDLLEAACILREKKKGMPTAGEVASLLFVSPENIRKEALRLEEEGYLRVINDDILELSEKGIEEGMRIMKKHRVLECFLSEILGMKRSAASEEACILEHTISDETTRRLEGFMTLPRGRGRRLQRGRKRIPALVDFPEGTDLKVLSVLCPGGCERLGDLGILPGEVVRIVHILNGKAVVVRVKGCDIALSHEIASSILVERVR